MKNALGNNRFFDPKTGAIGALVMGVIVFAVNSGHGDVAFVAAAKQAGYTFFFGGFMMRLVENIVTSVSERKRAIILATLVPGIATVGLTYIVHSIKGTPEPVLSTVPTAILAPSGFLWWAVRRRKLLS